MTQATIAGVIGFIVSVLAEVVPGFNTWWDKFVYKRLALLLASVGVPLVLWALACFTTVSVPFTPDDCGVDGAVQAVLLGLVAFAGEQTGFNVLVRKMSRYNARN